ncbi:acyl-CoA reductase [Catenovulum adriaticum]|uniref:Long-chain-fatty-acyl-CoA reductase n=1 Tax=Catenovulum adriaticum TaxID=2984846 RepID=A0ABY7ARR3_9ALTE|nr:acyl-CoA reductase [Catenovulum sp. TS8]WAJ71044.1 hypothetical protein OLW01_04365 [Catenovulum sp. TS8]
MTHLLKFTEQVKWHIKPANQQDMAQVIAPWHPLVCESVSGFSAFVLKQTELRQYPEIIALAYWFRASHINQLKQSATEKLSNTQNLTPASGKVFHIAPANVDTVFLYSVFLSVLAGNQNIVRVSERSGDITWLLIELLKHYLNTPKGLILKPLISINQYSAQLEGVTEQLSHWCDLRVIWGGDNAIDAISKIAPQTKQICFPDRYSVAVISLDINSDIKSAAQALLTDVLPFNQQACSSPKAIYWLNTEQNIQQTFWQTVKTLLNNTEHQLGLSNKVEQHILLQKLAAAYAIELNENCGNKVASFAKIQSIGPIGHCKVKNLTANMLAEHSGNGLVFEVDIESTNEIPYAEKLQGISYAGEQNLGSLKFQGLHKRTVPLGKALEFNPTWDGVDLIQTFLWVKSPVDKI